MKYGILACVLAVSAVSAQAAEYGRVISSIPVVAQVTSPQRSCWTEETVVRQPGGHGGAVIGGIFGALLGNSFGRGSGNVAATAAGAVLGAAAGSSVDDARSDVQTVRRCEVTNSSEQRTVGYDVTYEYAGQRYTTRMASDPGEWVPIRVTVEGASVPEAPVTTVRSSSTVTIVEDQPVVVYRRAPVYIEPPVYFGVGWGFHRYWGGGPGWHHR